MKKNGNRPKPTDKDLKPEAPAPAKKPEPPVFDDFELQTMFKVLLVADKDETNPITMNVRIKTKQYFDKLDAWSKNLTGAK